MKLKKTLALGAGGRHGRQLYRLRLYRGRERR